MNSRLNTLHFPRVCAASLISGDSKCLGIAGAHLGSSQPPPPPQPGPFYRNHFLISTPKTFWRWKRFTRRFGNHAQRRARKPPEKRGVPLPPARGRSFIPAMKVWGRAGRRNPDQQVIFQVNHWWEPGSTEGWTGIKTGWLLIEMSSRQTIGPSLGRSMVGWCLPPKARLVMHTGIGGPKRYMGGSGEIIHMKLKRS